MCEESRCTPCHQHRLRAHVSSALRVWTLDVAGLTVWVEERGLELHLEWRKGVVCGLSMACCMIGFAQGAENGLIDVRM